MRIGAFWCVIQPVNGCLVRALNEMPIDAYGHLDRVMAWLLIYVDQPLPLLDQ